MSEFKTELNGKWISDKVFQLTAPLIYVSDILGLIEVPEAFQTDFASVPRVPIVYALFGNRAHYESVLHDYLYRINSVPLATYSQANNVFFEAMVVREKSWFIRYGMYNGVVLGGWTAYHKRRVYDKL